MRTTLVTSEQNIVNRIYYIRGKKVMLDHDLAELYCVQTKALNQAIKRNRKRFPNDFMFKLTPGESKILKSQFVTSRWGGKRKLPYAFTEQGVAMLSSVLNSNTAIEVNIKIIRIFTRMREMLTSNKDILLKLEQLEKKVTGHDKRLLKQEEEILMIFRALKKLLQPPQLPRRKIGFRRANE